PPAQDPVDAAVLQIDVLASITRNSAFSTPSSLARRLATSTIAGGRSVQISRPPSPISRAAANPVSPGWPEGSSADPLRSLQGEVQGEPPVQLPGQVVSPVLPLLGEVDLPEHERELVEE